MSKMRVALIILCAIIAYLVIGEFRASVISALPYLLILLCPLFHLFIHRKHKDHGTEDKSH
jgi:predicted membrane protein